MSTQKTSTLSPSPILQSHKKTFTTAYGPKKKVSLLFSGPGRTKQSFKAECDINVIMSRYLKTGVLDFVSKHAPQYSDVSGIDYLSAMAKVAEAKSLFEEMPSSIRAKFDNRPDLFLDFVHDPANAPEMLEMGLLKPGTVLKGPEPKPQPGEGTAPLAVPGAGTASGVSPPKTPETAPKA